MIIYLASILSGILYGITESLNKNITENKYSSFSYAFLQWGLNTILYFIPFLFWGKFPTQTIAYAYLAGVLLCTIIGNVAIIKAYKTDDLSNINIISRLSLVIAFFSGIFLLGESVNIFKISGIISIVVGIIIIFYEKQKIRLSTGFIYALFCGVSFGMVAYFEKLSLKYIDVVSFIFLYNLFASFILLAIPKTTKDVLPIFTKYKGRIILARICVLVGASVLMWSLNQGDVSIINSNAEASFLLSTVFIGILILGERKNLAQKLTGSLLCTLGIILLNFF